MNQLRDRITEEVNQLKDDPGLIRRVVKTMRSRAQLCLRRNGGHVEGNALRWRRCLFYFNHFCCKILNVVEIFIYIMEAINDLK